MLASKLLTAPTNSIRQPEGESLMARVRAENLTEGEIRTRFSDVIDIWTAAAENDGLDYFCQTEQQAYNLVFRLNEYRKLMRRLEPQHITILDLFVPRKRRGSTRVSIMRRPIFDLSNARTLDGAPIAASPQTTDEVREAEIREAVNVFRRIGRAAPEVLPPKEHSFDSSKPMFSDDDDSIISDNAKGGKQ
jgi:hypothetical protein